MLLHASEQESRKGLGRLLRRPLLWVVLGPVLLLGGFFVGAKVQREGKTTLLIRAVKSPATLARHYLAGLQAKPVRLVLDIKHKHVQKLEHERAQTAENDGLLITLDADDSYVPATLSVGDERFEVKLRNKGNWRDSRAGDKVSFRVKLKGGKTVLGMSRFSLHAPATKGDMGEWFFHRWLAHLGLVSMHYDFVEVTVNGKDLGVHAIEESFTRRLVEHNERREGVLIRFDEYWSYYFLYYKVVPDEWSKVLAQLFVLSPIATYESARVEGSETLAKAFRTGKSLMEAFRQGELPTHQVFDAPKLARLFALTDVLGHDHNLELRNVRYYLNPITSLLEPVGYDQHLPIKVRHDPLVGDHRQMHGPREKLYWIDHFFRDPVFFEAYLKELDAISQPGVYDGFLAASDADYRAKLGIMYRDDATWSDHSVGDMRENIATIRRKLQTRKSIDAYLARVEGDIAELQLTNIHVQPVRVRGVSFDGVELPLEGTATWPVLEAKAQAELMPYATVRVKLPPNAAKREGGIAAGLRVRAAVLGTTYDHETLVRDWAYIDRNFLAGDFMRRAPNHTQFDFVQVDEAARTLRLKPGVHVLRESLILPGGYQLVAGPGVVLDLRDGAVVLSRSPVHFEGTAELPIIVRSSDQTGQGFAVLTDGQPSSMSHVRFEDLSNPVQQGWSMPGAVTIHEGVVTLRDVAVVRNRCEDALNLVRSKIDLERVRFEKTKADAFDCDFCRGEIRDSDFVECGNDGVDVSGSEITLRKLRIAGSGDKAVSAGEGSTMVVEDVTVRDSEIGLCSKDRSTLRAKGVDIDATRVGFAVFLKKAEFGVSQMWADDLKLGKLERPYLLEKGSSLTLDGKPQPMTHDNVKEILYGAEYGKSSR